MFWFKLVIPDVSTFQLTEDMTILGNRRTGAWSQAHAYRFYFSSTTGNIEFTARGSGAFPAPVNLITRPYLDRWYHLAAIRSGPSSWSFYVDGRALPNQGLPDIGNSGNLDGVSIGGKGASERFYGEIQELSIFHRSFSARDVNTNRLRDVPLTFPNLRGYYKLGYSTVPADNLKNFAPAPTLPLLPIPSATKEGAGIIDFPETDKQGEQSLFDSQKNFGRDAISPLSGSFSWQKTLFSRPTAGIPFEFRIGYNSGISFNSEALEGTATLYSEDAVMGPGWRHSFQTRLVASDAFLPSGSVPLGDKIVGLLTWDGSLETWQKSTTPINQPYRPLHREYRGELFDAPGNSDLTIWVSPQRLIHVFDNPSLGGRLREIRDFNGNRVTLAYDPVLALLDTVTDTSGTAWKFNYNAQSKLQSVTALGWIATFTYNSDPTQKLATFSHRGPVEFESTPLVSTTWTPSYGGVGGILSSILSPRGYNDVVVGYDKYGRKTSETDGGGRANSWAYQTPTLRQMTRTDGDGKKWVDTFDRKGRAIASADPLGNTSRTEYYNLGDPMSITGNPPCPVAGVVKRATEPLGWVTYFDSYDDRGNLLQRTDALGYVWRWTYPLAADAGTLGKLVERVPAAEDSVLPAITSVNVILLNRPLKDVRPRVTGETTDWENRYQFDSYGNLTRHEDDIGPLAIYSYDTRGLLTSAKDGRLTETVTTYFPLTGFPETVTSAFGTPDAATTRFEVTNLGWVKTSTNALDETVNRFFDINGNTIRTTDVIGRAIKAEFDSVGNQTASVDAKNARTSHVYDGSNLKTSSTDRMGNASSSTFNNRALPATATSPAVGVWQAAGPPVSQTITATIQYDDAGRVYRELDPAGQFQEHRYDANGNETEIVDRLGKVWKQQYDRLNRAVVKLDPLGNTVTTTYDEAGRLSTVTDARGNTTRHAYDGRGRLRQWTDPEGNPWIYTYDAVGNILDIEDALHGHYIMTYDARNLRLTERNQDNLNWIYTYDKLGRLKTQLEPTGISRILLYDSVGRLEGVQFSTSRENLLTYDDNNNVTVLRRREVDGTTTRTALGYDSLDRLISSTDTYGKTVGYGLDALGRVTGLTYPGGMVLEQQFDNLSQLRLQRTPAAWGSLELTYAWDKQGRLLSQKYPNGILRTPAWDEAGRQTSLGYTDTKATPDPADDLVLMALNYAYDKNGNQTSAREKGLITYPIPAPHDETSAYTAAGRLQTRTDATDPTGQKNWTYEFKKTDGTPSFNLSRAACPSIGTLSLTYDEDNRTTSLTLTPPTGVTQTQITNRYDALGRRISRRQITTVGSSSSNEEARYVLSLLGDMERILADTTASGTLTALYIHGPDLAVKLDPATPSNYICYHADSSGNIVRITDQTRNTVSQYTYSDYGRPYAVPTTPGSPDPNPYRFVGSQGVMAEPLLPGLYFMRARYYLADAGVFLSVDPVKNFGPGRLVSGFDYASQNPIGNMDPAGLWSIKGFVSTVITKVTTAVTTIVNNLTGKSGGGGSSSSGGGSLGGGSSSSSSGPKTPTLNTSSSPKANPVQSNGGAKGLSSGNTATTTKTGTSLASSTSSTVAGFAGGQKSSNATGTSISLIRPTTGPLLQKTSSTHPGLDISPSSGTKVYAAAAGKVVVSSSSQSQGNFIVIDHGNDFSTRYYHFSNNSIQVQVGDQVNQGDYIANVGNTGFVRASPGGDGSHLHFELRRGTDMSCPTVKRCYGASLNPLEYGFEE